jgi:serine/threonine protein kinase
MNKRRGTLELTICKRSRLWSSNDYEETRHLVLGAYGNVVEARLRCTSTTFYLKKLLPCKHINTHMWSLGCVMAELLTSKPMFDADDDAQTLLAIFRVLGVPLFMAWPA